MAGNYADVPSYRMAYDRDGSVSGYIANDGVSITQFNQSQMQTINDESGSGISLGNVQSGGKNVFIIFPELRDIVAYQLAVAVGGALGTVVLQNLQSSANTTNGVDGTWTTLAGSPTYQTTFGSTWRTGITSLAQSGVRAMRVKVIQISGAAAENPTMYSFHLYGAIAAGQTPNRLRFWHPTLDQEVGAAYFDWGDVPRSSSADRTFRLKNNSDVETANNINIGIEALTDATPAVAGMHSFSTDGTSFSGSISLTSLAPGAISGVLTVRRVMPSNTSLSLWAQRIVAQATTWT